MMALSAFPHTSHSKHSVWKSSTDIPAGKGQGDVGVGLTEEYAQGSCQQSWKAQLFQTPAAFHTLDAQEAGNKPPQTGVYRAGIHLLQPWWGGGFLLLTHPPLPSAMVCLYSKCCSVSLRHCNIITHVTELIYIV